MQILTFYGAILTFRTVNCHCRFLMYRCGNDKKHHLAWHFCIFFKKNKKKDTNVLGDSDFCITFANRINNIISLTS